MGVTDLLIQQNTRKNNVLQCVESSYTYFSTWTLLVSCSNCNYLSQVVVIEFRVGFGQDPVIFLTLPLNRVSDDRSINVNHILPECRLVHINLHVYTTAHSAGVKQQLLQYPAAFHY